MQEVQKATLLLPKPSNIATFQVLYLSGISVRASTIL